ncbi:MULTISPECIES: O-antigen ligase domain-containing protein [Parabacteroides]|uniref:O-antigen ligase family protein n=1 Tax=Parabacteroides leei TaxID=2939491 RepID=UPI001896D359|nr:MULTISPECIES: O-antigen ligase domain-containing protein [Parabacteroides]MCL3852148.1 O-antigen ligase domain-containing protein [Parabacteroides leei]
MIQDFVNRHFYSLFIITLIFGIVTYGLIGFQSIDELCAVVLFVMFIHYMFHTSDWRINKIFIYILGIFIFYLIYSLQISSNSKTAILVDFIIQLKPYIAFFCVYQIKPLFSKKQNTLLNQLCLLCWGVLVPFGIISLFYPNILEFIAGHPSNYASAIAALALVYLYTSNNTNKEKIIFICMLAVGLFSARSKFYGFFVLATFTILFFSNAKNLKFNFRNSIITLIMLGIILLVAKEKIELYFLQGISTNSEKDYIARFALYATSFQIFKDYFPFGSGLATFGTHASGAYYSDIYKEYEIDGIWGLSKHYPYFISDTYYPSLAQFGVVGALLFAIFWIYLCKKAYTYFKKTYDSKLTTIVIVVSGYFAIENIADATFTSNRGLFFMMFLGLVFSNMTHNMNQKETL